MTKPLPTDTILYELTIAQNQGDRILPVGTKIVILCTSPGGEYAGYVAAEWGEGKGILVSKSAVREMWRQR